jgi:hypothetical protein
MFMKRGSILFADQGSNLLTINKVGYAEEDIVLNGAVSFEQEVH